MNKVNNYKNFKIVIPLVKSLDVFGVHSDVIAELYNTLTDELSDIIKKHRYNLSWFITNNEILILIQVNCSSFSFRESSINQKFSFIRTKFQCDYQITHLNNKEVSDFLNYCIVKKAFAYIVPKNGSKVQCQNIIHF